MSSSVAQEVHAARRGQARSVPLDSGAQLSRALLSYLVVLISALMLLPFEFEWPATIRVDWALSPVSALAVVAMFVPYGFLTHRARTSEFGRQLVVVALSAGLLALLLEAVQLFEPACSASPWHVLSAVVGSVIGGWLNLRLHGGAQTSANAHHSLLLQLPLMGLVYLLLPLMWASGAAAVGDAPRLGLTVCVGLMGASILGSIARATRAFTPDRPWWAVSAVACTWGAMGMLPAARVDWLISLGAVALITVSAAWRGRWSAPQFLERRFETPALLAASPLMVVYVIGAAVWPGQSFRTLPLISIGVPTTDAGLALVLPIIETGIAATILGYMIAEFNGRSEASFRKSSSRVLFWVSLTLLTVEMSRSVFGFEGASVIRFALSLGAATYGAGLYHLQRAHIKVVADRLNPER